MYEKLKKLLDKSYSPYSGYKVAAIIVDNLGNEYKGVNVESVSFGATNCAERNAIQSAVTNGMKLGDLKDVYLLAFNTNTEKQVVTTCCGICRQVISEFSNSKAKIHTFDYETAEVTISDIDTLLPKAFLKEDLIV